MIAMEERNVKLSLEKAKEWYKKGGELKEVALQAYKEEELKDNRPHSWREYAKKHKQVSVGVGYSEDDKMAVNAVKAYFDATCALWKLLQLRQEWIGDWKPDWGKNNCTYKYVIEPLNNGVTIGTYENIQRVLSFPKKKMAEEFMRDFRDLLISALPLL